MSNVFFTADWHLNHHNIIRFCNRPFLSVEEMNDSIIQNINEVVKAVDTLYVLGDVAWNNRGLHLLKRVNCRNLFLIEGNHDNRVSVMELRYHFKWIKSMATIKVDKQKIVLCHYPLRVWAGSNRGVWNLFGHCHSVDPLLMDSTHRSPNSLDVGVDGHQMKPWSYEEVCKHLPNSVLSSVG